MNDTKSSKKKDKSQPIDVFVRVRPINEIEKNNKSKNVIEIPNHKELVVHDRVHDKFKKTFKFDHAFGPTSKQIEVYSTVISPLVEEILIGYNCTVFAYGQTGTGKTFTMEGETDFSSTLNWQNDSRAGMIPRALNHLFDKLQSLEAQEYSIRVSFLELYNEELFDLLSPNANGSKIRLYEDASKKGTIIINGVEEVMIQNKTDVYKILQRASERRRTNASLANVQSSRSHTIFSVTVHMKEHSIEGDEVLKTGKLTLVDLAGSENGRSSVVDKKAKEPSSINQSLLTLGRVITALVERAPHIPYRESKLTRLLQESLGGRAKTSIIATLSPASVNIEETISTLDYAHRAKSVRNRPEINHKLSKKEFLKQCSDEIEKLRKDLLATHERNGVYLADENYRQLQSLISQQTKEIEAKINHIQAIEKAMKAKERIFNELKLQNMEQSKKLDEAKMKLNNASAALDSTSQRMKLSAQERDEQKYLVEKYLNTEQSLLKQGQSLLDVANTATEDFYKLHDKISRKNETEQAFEAQGERFRNNVCECIRRIQNDISSYADKLMKSVTSLKGELDMETFCNCENLQRTVNQLFTVLYEEHLSDTNKLMDEINGTYSRLQNEIQSAKENKVATMESEHELVRKLFLQLVKIVNDTIDNDISTKLTKIKNVCEELDQSAATVVNIIDSACEHQLKAYNETCENVRNTQENVKCLRDMQRSTEKQKLLSEMMTNAYSQFSDLKRSEEEHYRAVREKYDRIYDICNESSNENADSYNKNIETRNVLRENILQGIERIKSDVVVNTKQCEEDVDQIAEQGTSLVNELKAGVVKDSEVLREYKNKVDSCAVEIQTRMDKDKRKILSLLKDPQALVTDVNKNQAAHMNDNIAEISNATKATSEKLETCTTEFVARSNNVTEELKQLENEIYKFFTQDMQRDVPTGTTPSKKEFSYPRQLTATSPHERILQRFRETRKLVESPEHDEDSFMIGITSPRDLMNSLALSDITLISSPTDDTVLATSYDSSKFSSTRNSINFTDKI